MSAFVFIDHTEISSATRYYNLCRWEPLKGNAHLLISRVVPIGNITLDSLLDRMIKLLPTKSGDVILVTHGAVRGPWGVITIDLTPETDEWAETRNLTLLMSDKTDAAIAPTLKIKPEAVARLRSKMRAVQAKKIRRIEFRGCDLGAAPAALRIIARFFGAQSVSAPKISNLFGEARFGAGTPPDRKRYEKAIRKTARRSGGHVFKVGQHGLVGFRFRPPKRTAMFRLKPAMATSLSDLKAWFLESFPVRLPKRPAPPGTPPKTNRQLKGGLASGPPLTLDFRKPIPVHFQFKGTREIHLPLSKGYRENLFEVR